MLEAAAQHARVPPHPDDHPGHGRDCDQRDDRLETLLLPVRQLTAEQLEADADRGAQPDRERDPGPHPAQHVAAAFLPEERGHDADDERRLDTLSEPDHEGGDHGAATAEFSCVSVM